MQSLNSLEHIALPLHNNGYDQSTQISMLISELTCQNTCMPLDSFCQEGLITVLQKSVFSFSVLRYGVVLFGSRTPHPR